MTRPVLHRRRSDPSVTIHHGANADCPDVRAGRTSRCLGHSLGGAALVPEEGPVEHLRNALAVIRLALDFGEPVFGLGDGPGVAVRVQDLARLQARVEAAISLLELDGSACCLTCGETILPPTIGGVPRGTCHCPENLDPAQGMTDWSAAPLTIRRND